MKKQRYTKCYKCGKRAKLTECKHCENYYCYEHSNPKIPLTPNMVFNEKDPALKQLYEEEWRRGGHTCVSYGEWKLNEAKKQKEIDNETLNKALDSIEKVPLTKPSFERFEPLRIPSYRNSHYSEHHKPNLKMPKIHLGGRVGGLIVVLLCLGFYFLFPLNIFLGMPSPGTPTDFFGNPTNNPINFLGMNFVAPKITLSNLFPICSNWILGLMPGCDIIVFMSYAVFVIAFIGIIYLIKG
jgi:hypothetical protein